jgi:hypothetical protein
LDELGTSLWGTVDGQPRHRQAQAFMSVAVTGALILAFGGSAAADPSPGQVRAGLLTPAEAANATRTPLLPEKATACADAHGCDRVLLYSLRYSRAYGDRQPAHLRIWDMGSPEAAQRFVRVSALYPPANTRPIGSTTDTFTTWLPPRNGWGLSERVQLHGSWIISTSCYGHTAADAKTCVDALGNAQLAKLVKKGLAG